MRKIFTYVSAIAMALAMTTTLASCSSDDDNNNGGDTDVATQKNNALEAAAKQYVTSVVYPTYTNLASQSATLYEQVQAMRDSATAGTLTQAQIDATCATFLSARAYWEKSEAWLYGPADVFGIDPHIDTWPLDRSGLATFFREQYNTIFATGTTVDSQILAVSDKNGDETSFLGFHGLEYILFRDGANRTVADFAGTEEDAEFAALGVTGIMELNLAVAIAGDLRDHCYWLECAWQGTDAPADHIARCNARSFTLTTEGQYRGPALMKLGLMESYATWRAVATEILEAGCMNICLEVSQQKMGQVWRCATGNGTADDSNNYIESPYSHKSFQDFYDNIVSIKNALYGNIELSSYHSNSMMAYLNTYNKTMADDVQAKLDASFAALQTCINGRSFVEIATSGSTAELATVKAAMDAIDALNSSIEEAKDWIQKN